MNGSHFLSRLHQGIGWSLELLTDLEKPPDGRTDILLLSCTELQLWDLVEAKTSGKPEKAQGTTLDYTNIYFTFVTFLKIKYQFK